MTSWHTYRSPEPESDGAEAEQANMIKTGTAALFWAITKLQAEREGKLGMWSYLNRQAGGNG
jgi:hypothetical protein